MYVFKYIFKYVRALHSYCRGETMFSPEFLIPNPKFREKPKRAITRNRPYGYEYQIQNTGE
jgi:hypothetical protein